MLESGNWLGRTPRSVKKFLRETLNCAKGIGPFLVHKPLDLMPPLRKQVWGISLGLGDILPLLQEMVRITRPGGQVLVYAWAVEQSAKYTVQDNLIPWHLQKKFVKGAGSGTPAGPGPQAGAGTATVPSHGSPNALQKAGVSCAVQPPNPTVAENGCTTADFREADASEGPKEGVPTVADPNPSPKPNPKPETDSARGQGMSPTPPPNADATSPLAPDLAVVYHRYYHLFKEGELEGLVDQIPGVKIVDRYYDHQNWVVVMERLTEEGAFAGPGVV